MIHGRRDGEWICFIKPDCCSQLQNQNACSFKYMSVTTNIKSDSFQLSIAFTSGKQLTKFLFCSFIQLKETVNGLYYCCLSIEFFIIAIFPYLTDLTDLEVNVRFFFWTHEIFKYNMFLMAKVIGDINYLFHLSSTMQLI